MKEEIRVGVEFLRQFLAKYGQLTQTQIDTFAAKLALLLEKRYVNHWYETQPMKGQAFRCLRLKRSEDYMDPVLEHILGETGLSLNQLGLPNDFTLWIDPGEVSVRFGDQVGYTYTIARLSKREASPQAQADSSSGDANAAKSGADHSDTQPKSALIVENSAKIFDEKLTAFIRQNSCAPDANTTTNSAVTPSLTPSSSIYIKKPSVEPEEAAPEDEFVSNELIEQLITLSAEKRTISPPMTSAGLSSQQQFKAAAVAAPVKRTNSSSIDINNNQ